MRKTSKKKAVLEEAAEAKAALEEIAKIRRNGFDLGEEMIKQVASEPSPNTSTRHHAVCGSLRPLD